MQKPSDQWKKLRLASLERGRRKMIEPFEPIFFALLTTSIFYLVGWMRLSFVDQGVQYSWITGAQIVIVTVAAVLLPFLTGSAVTVHFIKRRYQRLESE